MARARPQDLVQPVLAGERRALARALTAVENAWDGHEELLRGLYPHVGRGRRVGVTGPPGAGKSTLVTMLVRRLRERAPERVAVLAVDPTSPFSGGALLGDRVRMTVVAGDEGVYIRSMATRGAFGGLSRAASDAVDVLDAAGYDPVLVETVGVGQSEVEVAGVADTTLVVVSPESGDGVQALKAGVLEVADVFVVNKADRDGAERIARDLREMLEFARPGRGLARDDSGHHRGGGAAAPTGARTCAGRRTFDLREEHGGWDPPVVLTVATDGTGVDELLDALAAHQAHLEDSGRLAEQRLAALRNKVAGLVETTVLDELWGEGRRAALAEAAERIYRREETPYGAARALLAARDGGGDAT